MGLVAEFPAYLRFRESHHAVARWFALGLTISKVADLTGYSRKRLNLLLQDPTFQELIVSYHEDEENEVRVDIDVYKDVSTKNMIQSELQIQDRLDDDENPPSLSMLNKISQDRADRLGYGKNSTVKHEHTFAERLDAAIERSNKARVIEHVPKQIEASPPLTRQESPPATKPAAVVGPRLKRRSL